MTRYTMSMTEAQARVIQDALNVYFRLHLGQVGDALECLPVVEPLWYDDRRAAEDALHQALRAKLHPCCNLFNSSLGVGHKDFKAGAAVDLHCAIRHRLAWDRAIAEGITKPDGSRDWSTMLGVQYDEPMHYGSDPLPEIKQEDME